MTPAWRSDGARALQVQLCAAGLTAVAAFAADRLAGFQASVAHAVLLQAVLASLLSRWAGMARWWTWIHLLFVPAVAAVHALRLPPFLFLACLALLVALYWSSFRTQVPYYPSRRAAWDAVLGLLPAARAGRQPAVIDVGSGFGGLAMYLADVRRDAKVSGIELAPLPWLVSAARARWRRSCARFVRGDYETLDFGRYDLVFAYLSPAAMPSAWGKARREMRPGTLFVSHEFEVPGQPPSEVLPARPGRPALFVWRF